MTAIEIIAAEYEYCRSQCIPRGLLAVNREETAIAGWDDGSGRWVPIMGRYCGNGSWTPFQHELLIAGRAIPCVWHPVYPV